MRNIFGIKILLVCVFIFGCNAKKDINNKKLKKLSFSTNKSSDGNIYFGKGKYTFKTSSFQESFLVK